MNKYFILPILALALIFTGCNKENFATLEVINQTTCLHNIYDGVNSNGNFFAADPVNCVGNFEQQYQIDINKGNKSTMLID